MGKVRGKRFFASYGKFSEVFSTVYTGNYRLKSKNGGFERTVRYDFFIFWP